MIPGKATAKAHPNIAFIKYWGQADPERNLPANPSLSMALEGLHTITTVSFRNAPVDDLVVINGEPAGGEVRSRVTAHLDRIRRRAGFDWPAVVISRNSFPAATGLASSASAFAALTLAAAQAAGLDLDEAELAAMARLGSGSASRSVPGGFVLWRDAGVELVAPADHWELHDVIAVVSQEPKAVASVQGHGLAATSPIYSLRAVGVEERLDAALRAVGERDLGALGVITEVDTLLMHAVMMTSTPPLVYMAAGSVAVLREIAAWRAGGLPVYYTLDAGPNVHCLCEAGQAAEVTQRLRQMAHVVDVLDCRPGGPAHLIRSHLM